MNARLRALIDTLQGHSVLIWGARMTGLGFVRFCRSHQLAVQGFIDSDPAFAHQTLSGLPCLPPAELPALRERLPRLKVIIAASTKEVEIRQALYALGFADHELINYSDYCDLFYTIDVTGTCNLRCLSCPHGAEIEDSGEQKATQGQMDLETFTRVVDKIVAENDLVTHISLYSWGEPFLNPALPEMIRILHQRGIAAALSSNLSIKNETLLRKALQQDPEYLKVSLSGFYPEAYNDTHQGGDIYLVRSNLLRLRYYLNKFKLNTVVEVNYHLYNNNNGRNLQKMQELCDELGFFLSRTFALVMPLERVIDKLEGRASPSTLTLEKLLLVSVEEGIAASNPDGIRPQPCPFLENQTIVNWDLSVPVCCTTFNRGNNVLASNFLETPKAELHAKKQQASICTTCMQHGLPAYNLGLNRHQWETIAASKPSTDLPAA